MFFFLNSRCSRYFVPYWKICLGCIWANRKNRLCIPGLGNIFWPFFFEFSIVNVLKINLTKLVLIYASVNNIRIFHHRSRWTIAITWRPSSVFWRLSSVNFSHFKLPKPLGQLEPNLAGMFLGWSSTKFLFFVPVRYSTWLPGPKICSDWLKFQRYSSLKLMNWLNPNCKWMIIGMSFTKFLVFMPIGNPRWSPPQYID